MSETPHIDPVSVLDSDQFRNAIQAFDDLNAADPNQINCDGSAQPAELLYARRLTDWVLRLCPEASEPLRLATRSQHLCRWRIPRANYEPTKAGYLKWRNDLKYFHADLVSEILTDTGWDQTTIDRVRALNLKSGFPDDLESRILEDALCLVFLEFQLGELATRTAEDKVINALRKSWAKMRPVARDIALTLRYTPQERQLLDKALNP